VPRRRVDPRNPPSGQGPAGLGQGSWLSRSRRQGGADSLAGLADFSKRQRRMIFLLSWIDLDEEWLLLEAEALIAG
jgi:hypothetical protein